MSNALGDEMDPANAFFGTPAMAAVFSAEGHIGRMLAFEAALARAEARAGVIPTAAAEAIGAACRVELFDIAAIYREAALAGTVAIPLVRLLTERVEGEAGGFIHWGATSQDAIDTALVLQMRDGIDLLVEGLLDIAERCADLAEEHRRTPMVGRTLLQQALPITFGLKAARWLESAIRQVRRLWDVRERALAVQLGGAVGTLAALGPAGPRVAELLGEELGLAVPALPWHAERDRIAEVAAALGIVAGTMAKVATDLTLLRQSEVGELGETPVSGKGGSSAMPQKRNPVDATFATAAARLAIGLVPVVLGAMSQEHERAAGGWQAEWEAVPRLFNHTACAIERVGDALENLTVDAARMRANLDVSGGLVMAEALTTALAARLGRPEAFRLVRAAVERATITGDRLQRAALDDERIRSALSPDEIETAFDPERYLGSAEVFVDRALAAHRDLVASIG